MIWILWYKGSTGKDGQIIIMIISELLMQGRNFPQTFFKFIKQNKFVPQLMCISYLHPSPDLTMMLCKSGN